MTRALFFLLAALWLAVPASAQEAPPAPMPPAAPEAAAPAPAPVAAPVPAPDASPPAAVTLAPDAPAAPVTPPVVAEPLYRSLMFTGDELQRLRDALATYEENKRRAAAGQDFLSAIQGEAAAKNEPPSVSHRQFYLSTIVYYSPQNWTIWVNQVKYTPDTMAQGELMITGVTKQQVSFSWKPLNFQGFQKDIAGVQPGKGVSLDTASNSVDFILFANQTFSSQILRVTEGPPPSLPAVSHAPAAAPAENPENPPSAADGAVPSPAPEAAPGAPAQPATPAATPPASPVANPPADAVNPKP